jgi:NADH dehydrogenase
VNFVSAEDVAEYVIIALRDSRANNRILEIGGPENLTLNQVARVFEDVSGRTGKKSHVPLPLLRVMSVITKPLVPALSRAMSAGVYMDTADQRFDMNETLREFPMRLTRLQEFVQRTYSVH